MLLLLDTLGLLFTTAQKICRIFREKNAAHIFRQAKNVNHQTKKRDVYLMANLISRLLSGRSLVLRRKEEVRVQRLSFDAISLVLRCSTLLYYGEGFLPAFPACRKRASGRRRRRKRRLLTSDGWGRRKKKRCLPGPV